MMQNLKSIFSKKQLFNKPPNYCELIVTEKCFFKCKMCDMWKRKHETTPSIEEWKQFVTQFRKAVNLPFKMSICGGETLTYSHLTELIKHCTELGLDVSITTNGFLLNKKMAKQLYDAGLKEVVLSLDSYEEKTHDDIRGVNGSYKKVMKAIDNLSVYNVSINLLAVIMSLNLDSIIPLLKWANSNPKINSINFNALTKPICANVGEDWYINSSYSYLWPDNKVIAVLDEIIKLKKTNNKIGNPVGQLEIFKKYYKHPKLFVKQGKCHMGQTVSVNSEGHVFMCHYFGSIGNIKNDEFNSMWRSKKSKKIRKKILECERNCKMLVNCNFQE